MASGLGDLLLRKGLLSKDQVEGALQAARQDNLSLIKVLLRDGMVPEEALLRALAEQMSLRFVRLRDVVPEPAAVKSVSAKIAAHYHIMPLRLDGRVMTIAVSNPYDMAATEEMETNLGYRVERVLACSGDIGEALHRYYGVGAETVERILADQPDAPDTSAEEAHDLDVAADDASVVKLVNQILHQAISDRATDIHLENYRGDVTLRRRIDGVLQDTPTARQTSRLYPAIVSRLKLMAGLNIVERRLPQDGRTRVRIGSLDYDLRLSIVPTLYGENVVIRILPTSLLRSLEDLGLSPHHREILDGLLHQPHGILFVTGPTGSGKSTTLYACLSRLNTRERKIITIEEPVEYELKGITQTQIHPKIGLTFAHALRSMLRHDPDVMMVGEVRDLETAEVAVQTALTGHLVFSTLHTNDAPSAAVRLIDMGVDPYLITSTVRAFIAQRLVRTICPQCRETYENNGRVLPRGRGCPACHQTGYFGRIGIYEILLLVPAIQDLILQRASSTQIRDKALALGMTSLAADGWEKVGQGITTADEVLRVTFVPEG